MAQNIVRLSVSKNDDSSPFDAIRQSDDRCEYWSARDLQVLLGYAEWRKFSDAIDRAKASLKANGHKDFDHIVPAAKMIEVGKGGRREVVDYHLTRFACYMVAMNGDPRKPEIAAAQSYFAIKTREAETIISAQSEGLRKLELENENMRLKLKVAEAQQKTLAAAGLMSLTAPAIVEAIMLPGITVIEKVEFVDRTVIKDGSGKVISQLDGLGITAIQKQFGFKSTKAAWAWLESIGYGKDSGHWQEEDVAHSTLKLKRSALADLKQRFVRHKGDRQKLLGE